MSDDHEPSERNETPALPARALRRAGVGAAAIGVAGSGASKAFAFAGPHKHTGRWLSGDLKILQWVHFVPAYDQWFDNTWIKQWGQKNDVNVTVDHIVNTQLDARAASEVAAQSGHDLFHVPRAAGDLRGPGDQPQRDRPGDREEGREVRQPRQAVHLQPEDEEVLRRLRLLRPRSGRVAARPLERRRRGADDVGARAQGGAEAEGGGPSDRHRACRTSSTRTWRTSPS